MGRTRHSHSIISHAQRETWAIVGETLAAVLRAREGTEGRSFGEYVGPEYVYTCEPQVFLEPWLKVRSCYSARFLSPLLLCLCTVLCFLWCLSCTCPRTNIYCTMHYLEKFQFSIFLSESRVCPGFSSGNVVILNYSLKGHQEVTTLAPHLGVYSGSS